MHCSEVQKQLSFYLDGELPRTQSAALAAHLETCAVCAQQAARLRWLVAALAEPVPDPPRDFAAQVRARLAARQAERAALRSRRWAFGLAATVAGCGVLWILACFLPPLALPWTRWTVEVAAIQGIGESIVASMTDGYHAVPLWGQQTWAGTQALLARVGDTLGRVPVYPWWEALRHGLWVALGLAIAGNILNHLHQQRMTVGVRG